MTARSYACLVLVCAALLAASGAVGQTDAQSACSRACAACPSFAAAAWPTGGACHVWQLAQQLLRDGKGAETLPFPHKLTTVMAASSSAVAEIVTFTLNDGVTEEAFLADARALKSFFTSAPGFIDRRLSTADGKWTDYVQWATMEDALAAAKAIGSDPAAAPFLAAINESSIDMKHQEVVLTM
eukprot:PLAT14645.1.p1 GENE.PLAT14645.1~~PLAT14645.1.p1  ORF type:complete len:184 (-),score=51.59 PLAT14645.1:185-736(-)